MTATATKANHPAAAAEFVRDDARAHWHDQALWFVRVKRDRMARSLPEWETLREKAGAIKAHTISLLPDYLEQFEREATRRGAVVHWARDAAEHNEIVLRLLQQHGAKRIAKSKSMLTEECHLNPFLERHGIEVTDTDLGEWIVQLRHEAPSHIVSNSGRAAPRIVLVTLPATDSCRKTRSPRMVHERSRRAELVGSSFRTPNQLTLLRAP